jgi:hypothetical protein
MAVCVTVVGLSVMGARPPAGAQSVGRTALHVEETAGIRRFFYPVDARVPFPRGTLVDPTRVRLLREGVELPAQYTAFDRWPDDSVRWLAVNFNISIGPLERQTYEVEYGPGTRVTAETPRGLTVTETAETIQVSRMRFGKDAAPLLASVDYAGEHIGTGPNGISVRDYEGNIHQVSGPDVVFEVVRQGAQYVELRYTGRFVLGVGASVPFTMRVGIPNSKSWFQTSIVVEDPERRVRDLVFQTPLTLGDRPWVWDFGTDRWTYGSLRAPEEAVQLSVVADGTGAAEWEIDTRRAGESQAYEVGGERSLVEGWGHLQGPTRAVAFAMGDFAREAGTYTMGVDGAGQLSMMVSRPGRSRHELTVYQHYVSVPVHIGAATSPMSMLNPPVARCEPAWYTASGVEAP